MPGFNVNEFKSKIDRAGGLAKPNLFFVEFTPPNWMAKQKSLSLGDKLNNVAGTLAGVGSIARGIGMKGVAEQISGATGVLSTAAGAVNRISKAFDKFSGGDKPLGMGDIQNNLYFFCNSAMLPGISLAPVDHREHGYGMVDRRPNSGIVDQLMLTFTLDNGGMIMKFFHNSVNQVFNYNVNGKAMNTTQLLNNKEAQPFEFGYHDDYVHNELKVSHLRPDGSPITQYTFHGAYPAQIGDVSMSWGSNDEVALLPVGYMYRNWTSSHISPSGGTGGKSLSLGDKLQKIGSIAQTISTLKTPRSVGDAVNLVNNASLIASNLNF
tara:strand:+ start:1512 stop:2480 length:969 start_codon:yes stop_codon:yes gene_type:complete